jgi:hypothetical protein
VRRRLLVLLLVLVGCVLLGRRVVVQVLVGIRLVRLQADQRTTPNQKAL